MPLDPFGNRYPQGSDVPDVAQYIKNVLADLADNTITDHSTTTARDNAWAAWVALGNTLRNGLRSVVNGVPYRRINGTWRIDRENNAKRTISTFGSGGVIASGGAAETGSTAGYSTLSNFTLYEASTVNVQAHFRVNPGAGGAGCRVKIDGAQVGFAGATRNDISCVVIGSVALAAGTHSISLRVDAVGASVTWSEGEVTFSIGAAE